jgi:hypothetical protein
MWEALGLIPSTTEKLKLKTKQSNSNNNQNW